jgi:hypothetical protein
MTIFIPSNQQIHDFINDRSDGNTLMTLWCKSSVQRFIDQRNNINNAGIFSGIYSGDIRPTTYKVDNWKSNDKGIKRSLGLGMTLGSVFTRRTDMEVAQLIRMIYYREYGSDMNDFKQVFSLTPPVTTPPVTKRRVDGGSYIH